MQVEALVRGPDGKPVAGAGICIVESSVPLPESGQLADDQGRAVLELPAGRFVIEASSGDGRKGQAAVTVLKGQELTRITISLKADP